MNDKLEDGGVKSAPDLNTGVRPRHSQQGMAGTGNKDNKLGSRIIKLLPVSDTCDCLGL